MAFVDLEKVSDRVPRKVIWWALRKLGVEIGLCGWCRWCMPMRSVVYMLVRGTVKRLKWRSVFTKAGYSACCSSSLCLKPCKFGFWVPWEDLYAHDLVIIAELLKECVRRLLTWKEAMEEKGLGEMQERQSSWSVVPAWTSCRIQASFHVQSVALEWVATASSAMAASTGCTRNAVGSSAWQRTKITNVQGARELHSPWTTDHRGKSKLDLTLSGGGGLLLLLRRHALSSWWL